MVGINSEFGRRCCVLLAALLLTGCLQPGQGAPASSPSSAAAPPSTVAPSVTPSPTQAPTTPAAVSTPRPVPSRATLPTVTLKPPAGSVALKGNEINVANGSANEFYKHPSGCAYGAFSQASNPDEKPERASSQTLLSNLQRSALISTTAEPVVTQLTTDRGPVNALLQTGKTQTGELSSYVARAARNGQAVAMVMTCPSKSFNQATWDAFRTGSVFTGFDAAPEFRD